MDCKRYSSHLNYMLAKRNLQITHKRYHSYDSGVLSDADMSRNTLSSADSEQSCCSALYSLPDSSDSTSRGCSTNSSSKSASHGLLSPQYHGFAATEDLRPSCPPLTEVEKLPWTEAQVLLCLQSGKFKDTCDNLSVECLRRLSYLLQRPLVRITREAKRFSSVYNKCSRHNIQSACQIVLSSYMYSECNIYASKAVSMYSASNQTRSDSKSDKCSLTLSVGNHHRWLLDFAVAGYISELSAVYLCAVMETIIEQTVTQAISAKCLENGAIITTDMLEAGIWQSAHLYSLYDPYSQLLAGRNHNEVVIPTTMTCHTPQPSLVTSFNIDHLSTTCVSSIEELSDVIQHTCSCPDPDCRPLSWSRSAIDTLFYYVRCESQTCRCNECSAPLSQERWSRMPPPLMEWIRVGTGFTQQRKAALVDSDDVRQAARVLLPNCDCAVRPLRQLGLSLPSSDSSSDTLELLQWELALSLLLDNTVDTSSQAIPLLHKHGINKHDGQGLTPLMCACIHGSEMCVMKLLQAGADPSVRVPALNNPTCAGWTALHFSVATENAAITQLLLEYVSHADMEDTLNCHVETPLQIAAAVGSLNVLDLLLCKHADPFWPTHFSHLKSSSTFTSLTLAASHGHILAVRRLCAGAILGVEHLAVREQITLTNILSCSETKPPHYSNEQSDACSKVRLESEKLCAENDYMVIEHEYMTIEEVFQTDNRLLRLEDRLSMEHIETLADALYNSSESGYLDISMEIHFAGIPWSLYTWYATLNAAHKCHRKALIQSLLHDFHTAVYLSEKTPLLLQHCLPLMFEIFRESKNEMISYQLSTIFTQLYGAQPLPVLKDSHLHPRPLINCDSYSNSQDHADISFVVNGKLFYAHKIILVGASQTFRSMLSSFTNVSMPQIEIADMDCTTFENVLQYLYGGVKDVVSSLSSQCSDHRSIKNLLAASHYFKLDGLKRKCEILLSKNVSLDNCLSVYKVSKTYECTDLMEMCEEYFLHNLSTVLKSNDAFKRVLYSTKLHNRELLSRLLATLINRLSDKCH